MSQPRTPSPATLALHERVLATRRAERAAVRDLAVALVEMADGGGFAELGYASIEEYAWAHLEVGARKTRALIQIGRSLPERPHLDAAMREGRLEWTKARDIQAVLTEENEEKLVDLATRATNRQIEVVKEDLRDGKPVPDEPPPERRPDRERRVIDVLTADGDALDHYLTVIRAQSGDADLQLGEVLAALVRKELERLERDPRGAEDVPTREPYTVVLHRCDACRTTSSGDADVNDTVVGEAACDAEVVDEDGRNDAVIPRRIRRQVLARDGWCCSVPACRLRTWLHLHHLRRRADGGPNVPANLITLCSLHHRRVHEGVLAIEVVGDQLVVARADGRRRIGPWRGAPGDARAAARGATPAAGEILATSGMKEDRGWADSRSPSPPIARSTPPSPLSAEPAESGESGESAT